MDLLSDSYGCSSEDDDVATTTTLQKKKSKREIQTVASSTATAAKKQKTLSSQQKLPTLPADLFGDATSKVICAFFSALNLHWLVLTNKPNQDG